MKISLISVALELSNLSYPLGALCVESAINNDKELKHIKTETLLFEITENPKKIARKLNNQNIDIVGLSIYLWNRDWFDIFICELKQINSKVKIFAGGTEVSANYKSFDINDYIFMIAGEGENTTVKALKQYINGEEIKGQGIMSKTHDTFSYSEVLDLSNLSSPILSGKSLPFMDRYNSILWEMTRGCPFHCGFCFESKGLRSVRNYPFDRIEKELDIIVKKGVPDVFVLDPTFNIDKKRTLKILNLIKRKAPNVHFTFELRAELLDEQLANAFSEVFCSLQIGLQSIHKEVLNTVNRNFNIKLFKEKITLLERRGLVYGLDLIAGLPNDTLERFKESLNFTVSCKPSNIDIFPLALLPGTKIAEQAEHFKLKSLSKSPYTIIETPSLSKKDLKEIMKIKRGCDLFYTKGQSVMYTTLLCDTFKITPDILFYQFDSLLHEIENKGNNIDDIDIFELQDSFIKNLIRKYRKEEFKKPLLSYIEMHQGISYFHETGDTPLMNLSYSPNDLSLLDRQNIEKFYSKHKPFKKDKSYVIVPVGNSIDIVEYK